MLKKLILQSACTTLLLSSFITSASVVSTITFDESIVQGPTAAHNFGTIIDNEYENTNFLNDVDVTFWADQAFDINNTTSNNDLFLTLFNSEATFQTLDQDLVVPTANFGNIAVIHERNGDCSLATNSCYSPDDRFVNQNTGTNGGYIFAEFSEEVILNSIGLVDLEPNSNQTAEIAFFDENRQLIGNWVDLDVTGNGGYTTQAFDLQHGFTYLAIHFVGSGGFTDLEFSSASATSVPEPSTLVIFALGLMGLASRRLKK